MNTKCALACFTDKKAFPARRSAEWLLKGGMALVWLFALCNAIGKGSQESAAPSLIGSTEQGSQDLQELLADLHKDSSYGRQRAAIALGNTKDARAVEPLIQSLQDDDDFVRSFSARSLGNIGDPRAIDPLIKALDDKHLLVRRAAAKALGKLKNPRSVDALINALESGDVLVRRSAAEALGEIGDPKAVDPLIKALESEDSYIQAGAAIALAGIGRPAIPKLKAKLGDPKIGPRAEEVLRELHWQPSSEQEKAR